MVLLQSEVELSEYCVLARSGQSGRHTRPLHASVRLATFVCASVRSVIDLASEGVRDCDTPFVVPLNSNPSLPPHLREVCQILARGIVRLRSRSIAAIDPEARECGESSLHSTPHQRRHANPRDTEDA